MRVGHVSLPPVGPGFVRIGFPFLGQTSLPLFWWLLNKKAARVEVNISLAFLYWVVITLQSTPDLSSLIQSYICAEKGR